MKIRFLLLAVALFCLAACRNGYHSSTYDVSDTYGDVFEGRLQPYDMRAN